MDLPIRKRTAVYLKVLSAGNIQYIREPYNIVSINGGDGTPISTYMEPHCGQVRSPSERQDVYDDIQILDVPPWPKSRIGYGGPGQ